jgi:hypothetical protein
VASAAKTAWDSGWWKKGNNQIIKIKRYEFRHCTSDRKFL